MTSYVTTYHFVWEDQSEKRSKCDVSLKAGIHPVTSWEKYSLDLNLQQPTSHAILYIDTTKPLLIVSLIC